MCDAKHTERGIVGEILKVYPAGVDDKGRQIFNQRARIVDPITITGIIAGSIPGSWSVFLYAKQLKDRMVQGVRGAAVSIVDEPAYTEAEYEWRRLAASFLPLITPSHKNQAIVSETWLWSTKDKHRILNRRPRPMRRRAGHPLREHRRP